MRHAQCGKKADQTAAESIALALRVMGRVSVCGMWVDTLQPCGLPYSSQDAQSV